MPPRAVPTTDSSASIDDAHLFWLYDAAGDVLYAQLASDVRDYARRTQEETIALIGAVSAQASGLVPALPSTNQTTQFFRGDGSWAVPAGGSDADGGAGWTKQTITWSASTSLNVMAATGYTIPADGLIKVIARNDVSGYSGVSADDFSCADLRGLTAHTAGQARIATAVRAMLLDRPGGTETLLFLGRTAANELLIGRGSSNAAQSVEIWR